MGNIIANDLDTFRRDISQVNESLQHMKTDFNTMFEEIHALTGMWTGPAHDIYQAMFKADAVNMDSVFRNLDSFLEGLREAEKAFQTCENEVAQDISSLGF